MSGSAAASAARRDGEAAHLARLGSNETAPLSNMKSIWPPIRSTIAGELPLYGTCWASIFTTDLNSSALRCPELPLPPDP